MLKSHVYPISIATSN